jgi:hypothetical protein
VLAVRAHRHTRTYNDSGSHHSYVRISRLVFPVSPCVFAPSPCSHAMLSSPCAVSTRAVLKLRRHRRHFRVSILFLPLPPLIVWAVRAGYRSTSTPPLYLFTVTKSFGLALSRARHAMRLLLGDPDPFASTQPH